MRRRLLLLLLLVPLAEIILLRWIAEESSLQTVLGIVVASAVFGVVLARWHGVAVWRSVQHDLAQGRMPANKMLSGVLVLLASVLFIVPGILTDLVGAALLIPPIRRWLAQRVTTRVRERMGVNVFTSHWSTSPQSGELSPDDDIIDAEVVRHVPVERLSERSPSS